MFWFNRRGRVLLLTGFTLTETLLALAILVAVAAATIASFGPLRRGQILDDGAETVLAAFRLARAKTLSSEQNARYGVYFDVGENKLTIFRGGDFASGEAVEEISLDPRLMLDELNLAGGAEAVFSRLSGEAVPPGTLKIKLRSDSGERLLRIATSGLAGVVNQ